MKLRNMLNGKRPLWFGAPLLVLPMLCFGAGTDVPPPSGGYCPGKDILFIAAEGLSASLNLAMESRAALTAGDRQTAQDELREAGTTLNLAASRGAAARTNLLIDSVIAAKNDEDYAALAGWLPLLTASLAALPNDGPVREAEDQLNRAEAIMRGDEDGDALSTLKSARHMLACDGLDIPLKEAIRAQQDLVRKFAQGKGPGPHDYDALLGDLHDALDFTLANKQMAVREGLAERG